MACGATAGTISGSLWKRVKNCSVERQRSPRESWHPATGKPMMVSPSTPRMPGFFGRFRHHVLEIIHVGEGGGAGQHHFEQPSRVPQRTKSAVTFCASAGKMKCSSQSCSFMSSAMPRKSDMAACVCVLIRPGARIASGRSSRCARLVARVDLGARPDCHNALAADGNRAVLDHAPLRIHGDHVARRSRSSRRIRAASAAREQQKATKKTHRRALEIDLSNGRFRSCRAG